MGEHVGPSLCSFFFFFVSRNRNIRFGEGRGTSFGAVPCSIDGLEAGVFIYSVSIFLARLSDYRAVFGSLLTHDTVSYMSVSQEFRSVEAVDHTHATAKLVC